MSTFIALQKKIKETLLIDFSDLFNNTIYIYKKVWLQGVLYQLINILLGLPLLFINSEVFNFETIITYGLSLREINNEYLSNTSLSDLALWYLVLFTTILISTILSFGFFRVLKYMDVKNEFKFSDFFYYLNGDRLGKSMLIMLSYFGIAVVAALLCVLPLFYVMIPLMFVAPMFAYNPELSVSEILKLSFHLGHKKWGITFLITILNGIFLYLITIFTFGLGSLFLGCIMQLPIYIIYKKTLGDNSKEV